MNWSRVDYCDAFISCLDFHSDGTQPFTEEEPLVSKWCNAEFIQICSDEKKKKLIYMLDGLFLCWTQKGKLDKRNCNNGSYDFCFIFQV